MSWPMDRPALLMLQASDMAALRALAERVRAQCHGLQAAGLHDLVATVSAEEVDAPGPPGRRRYINRRHVRQTCQGPEMPGES